MKGEAIGGWAAYPQRSQHHPARSEVGDDGVRLDESASSLVVGLGALCGFLDADDTDAERYWVAEYALLADGRKVILSEDRGFSFGPPIGPTPAPAITTADIVDTVRVVVLPDPDDGEEHSWADLARNARQRGLDVTEHELRNLRYDIELTDSFTERLRRNV